VTTRAVDLTPCGKLLRTFPHGLENGAPTPFPTDTTATTTTRKIGYSSCTQNRGEIEEPSGSEGMRAATHPL
jgi:hypothetical protein